MILSPDSSNHVIPDNNVAHPDIVLDVPSHHREPALNLGTYLEKNPYPLFVAVNFRLVVHIF